MADGHSLATVAGRRSCAAGLSAVECTLSGGRGSCTGQALVPCGARAFSNHRGMDAG